MTCQRPTLTQERVQEILDYDPETGIFRRRTKCGNGIAAGSIAGSLHHSGYYYIRVEGRRYPATHLAWLYMTGEMPTKWIDHKNRNPADNRWENLREATVSQNRCNTPARADNKTGVKGVYLHRGRYNASIRINGKLIHVGCFSTIDEAEAARDAVGTKYHGEFFVPSSHAGGK